MEVQYAVCFSLLRRRSWNAVREDEQQLQQQREEEEEGTFCCNHLLVYVLRRAAGDLKSAVLAMHRDPRLQIGIYL